MTLTKQLLFMKLYLELEELSKEKRKIGEKHKISYNKHGIGKCLGMY